MSLPPAPALNLVHKRGPIKPGAGGRGNARWTACERSEVQCCHVIVFDWVEFDGVLYYRKEEIGFGEIKNRKGEGGIKRTAKGRISSITVDMGWKGTLRTSS